MPETMLSVGIDIGTTTTQVIFSRLTLEKSGGFGTVPEINVTNREVIYKGEPHFTPLTDNEYIDSEGVGKIIENEYAAAGIKPEMIETGAVIITGETARKRNAREVSDAVSKTAGDFVVASCGPDLESYLAGKGAGADILSKKTGKAVLNIDIGGGTSNYCEFQDGEEVDNACIDIGGRIIHFDEDGRIDGATEKTINVLKKYGFEIKTGQKLSFEAAEKIAEIFAEFLAEAAGLSDISGDTEYLYTSHGLIKNKKPDIITFSGGVADCMVGSDDDWLKYRDLGIVLGRAIKKSKRFASIDTRPAAETMHATVIGAGNCSMSVSGSTISSDNVKFPMKNIPVFPIKYQKKEDLLDLRQELIGIIKNAEDLETNTYALFMEGPKAPSFNEVEMLSEAITSILPMKEKLIPVIVEHDFAKALGQSMKRRIPSVPILCLDGIRCHKGDYIDIGKPVGGGIAIPVIVKTLVFNN